MIGSIERLPPDHRGGYQLDRDDVVVTADDYDEAMTQIRGRLPDGWRLLFVRVERE
jgi:hypothetical protein